MFRILVIHGPNLNLLGQREPALYGSDTLADINEMLSVAGAAQELDLEFFQSNSEEKIIDRIQSAPDHFDGLLINPAAFTHTSLAIADAIAAIAIPVVEVHITNIHAREEFRRKSFISPVASAVVTGFGASSYRLALDGLLDILQKRKG